MALSGTNADMEESTPTSQYLWLKQFTHKIGMIGFPLVAHEYQTMNNVQIVALKAQ